VTHAPFIILSIDFGPNSPTFADNDLIVAALEDKVATVHLPTGKLGVTFGAHSGRVFSISTGLSRNRSDPLSPI
jgi:hypothetical protein